jgi:hypothetical protein
MIRVLKYITGEVVIGDVQKNEDGSFRISDYYNIVPTEKGIKLIRYDSIYSDESIIEKVNPNAIAYQLKPGKNLEMGYLSNKSGIDLSAANSVIS